MIICVMVFVCCYCCVVIMIVCMWCVLLMKCRCVSSGWIRLFVGLLSVNVGGICCGLRMYWWLRWLRWCCC